MILQHLLDGGKTFCPVYVKTRVVFVTAVDPVNDVWLYLLCLCKDTNVLCPR